MFGLICERIIMRKKTKYEIIIGTFLILVINVISYFSYWFSNYAVFKFIADNAPFLSIIISVALISSALGTSEHIADYQEVLVEQNTDAPDTEMVD